MALQDEMEKLREVCYQRYRKTHHPTPDGELLDSARAEGFSDCEELIAQMLETKAEEEREKAGSRLTAEGEHFRHMVRCRALMEAALAVRLGQHRREVEP